MALHLPDWFRKFRSKIIKPVLGYKTGLILNIEKPFKHQIKLFMPGSGMF